MTRLFQRLITMIAGLYSAAVVVYLVLRLLFGDGFWWLSLVNMFAYLVFVPLLVLIPARCRMNTPSRGGQPGWFPESRGDREDHFGDAVRSTFNG